jgi:SAM-dependent methyltransferase
MHLEVIGCLSSYQAFQSWFPEHQPTDVALRAAVEHVLQTGIESAYFGPIAPSFIRVDGNDYREQLIAYGLNARQRALLECMATDERIKRGPDIKIYAPEAITPLAMTLRGRHRFFIGSEFYPAEDASHPLYPVPYQDLLNLSFASETFDVVITSDVLEHVSNMQQALCEMARVLKPGGLMLSTHPFTWHESTLTRAILKDGEVALVESPEYHQNPAAPEQGSLVFAVPGWDIIEACKAAGFAQAEMLLIASTAWGIFGGSPSFVNVLRAYR